MFVKAETEIRTIGLKLLKNLCKLFPMYYCGMVNILYFSVTVIKNLL